MRWLTHPSLRMRFLIAPALGLIAMSLLIFGFLHQIDKQRDMVEHVVLKSTDVIGALTKQFTELSKLHLDIYELLNSAESGIDEGSLYDAGKATLNKIHRITQNVTNLRSSENAEVAVFLDQQQLVDQLNEYIHEVTSAVEMTTVDLNLAATYLSKANKAYAKIKLTYSGLLERAQAHMNEEVATSSAVLSRGNYILSLTAVASAFGLMLLSYALSKLLSRSLREQIESLDQITSLDIEGEPNEPQNGDEISKLKRSMEVVKSTFEQIHQQEEELELTNRLLMAEIEERKGTELSLQKAVDSLKLIQGQLEDRVNERTRSLSNANKSLLNEISERKKVEQRLLIYQQVIEHTGEAVMITSPTGAIVEVNPAYIKMTGYEKQMLLNKGMDLVKSGRHSNDFYRSMWTALRRTGHWSGEIWNRRSNGEIFPQWVTINAVFNEDNQPQFYVGIFRDISELKKAEQKLEQLAFYDPLTGLPNRALFNDRLSSQILASARRGNRFAVLFIDLDRFKFINDTLGHSAGDKLLIEVSQRIRENLRETDTVARMGGDEFTVLAESITSEEDAQRIGNKIISEIQEPVILGDQKFYVSASIGIGLYPDHGTDAELLKKHSDMAMYRAKELGRSQVCVFEHSLSIEKSGIATLATDIVNAMERDEFYLQYQPIIDLKDDSVVGAEALIRWHHPEKGMIVPDRFIPYAEELGLIGKIDQWVLHHACSNLMQHFNNDQLPLPGININMSSSQFQQEDTPAMLSQLIANTGIPAGKINLEITETAVISNPEMAGRVLEQIKEIGIGVSIDDFGTGYSSLSYLTRFPVSRIKIDRSFVSGLPHDEACEAVVRSILRLADGLGLEVVAEGVETEQQSEFLKSAGCQFAQGYLYGKPDDLEKFAERIEPEKRLTLVK